MLGLKLNHVSKRGHWWPQPNKTQQNQVYNLWDILDTYPHNNKHSERQIDVVLRPRPVTYDLLLTSRGRVGVGPRKIAEQFIHSCTIGHLQVGMSRLNSLRPSDKYMHQCHIPRLLQIMARRLFGAKPLSVPMLGYYQLDLKEHISVKLYLKFESSFKQMHLKM